MNRVDRHGNPTNRKTYGERFTKNNVIFNFVVMALIILVGLIIGENLVVSAAGWAVGWFVGHAIGWLVDGRPTFVHETIEPKVEILSEQEYEIYER